MFDSRLEKIFFPLLLQLIKWGRTGEGNAVFSGQSGRSVHLTTPSDANVERHFLYIVPLRAITGILLNLNTAHLLPFMGRCLQNYVQDT